MANLHLDLIRQALAEDGADADVTTLSTVPIEEQTQANIITRQAGVIAGLAVAVATFRELDQRVQLKHCSKMVQLSSKVRCWLISAVLLVLY